MACRGQNAHGRIVHPDIENITAATSTNHQRKFSM
jgi:hypothetical protein